MIPALLVASALLFTSSVNAFWRLPCAKPVLNARVDPIVNRGTPSTHLHTIMGSDAISFNTTFEDLRNSDCTTCKVKDDKSAYWIPQLYYNYPNGSFQAVPHGGMLVYYLQRGDSSEKIQAFPDGFRMVAGDTNARSYKGTPASRAITWNCLGPHGPLGPQTPGITMDKCPWGLRAQIFFPGCWDGVNLDSPDHKSHVAYPDGIDNGKCPATHPVHLVSIFYEVYFGVGDFTSRNDGGFLVLANGDTTGFGLHGDFMNGWDRNVLQRAVDTCTNLSGVIEDCPVFNNEGRFEEDSVMQSCAAKNPIPSEAGWGDGLVLDHLPGCIAVTSGPGDATPRDLVPGCVSGNAPPSPPPAPISTSASMSNSNPPSSMSTPISNSGMSMSVTPASNPPSPPLTGLNREAIPTAGSPASPTGSTPQPAPPASPSSGSHNDGCHMSSHSGVSPTVLPSASPSQTSSSMSKPWPQTTNSASQPAPPASSPSGSHNDPCHMSSGLGVSPSLSSSMSMSGHMPQMTNPASQPTPSSSDPLDDEEDCVDDPSDVSSSTPSTASVSIPSSASPSQTSSHAGAGRRHHSERMRRSRHLF